MPPPFPQYDILYSVKFYLKNYSEISVCFQNDQNPRWVYF